MVYWGRTLVQCVAPPPLLISTSLPLASADGEMVPFCEELYPTGNVEDWLLEVERVMRSSLKAIIRDSLVDYTQVRGVECVCAGQSDVCHGGRRPCVSVYVSVCACVLVCICAEGGCVYQWR